MELIHQDGFYKVWASRTGAYVTVWSSDYPSKYSLLGTCESMDEALDLAFNYTDCILKNWPFPTYKGVALPKPPSTPFRQEPLPPAPPAPF